MILVVDAERLQQSTIESWEVVLAVLVLILAWILSLFTRRGIRRFGSHLRGVDDELLELAARFGSYTVLFIGIGVSLSVLGAPIQPLLAAAVIFGIVLAISLRGIADNFASGIVIQTRGTIHVNDEIAALGYQGRVRELNGRSVVVETSDGALVHLPNARILSNPYANLSQRGARRSKVEVEIGSSDLALPMADILGVVRDVPGVVSDPAPDVQLLLVEPHGVVALIGFWHEPSDGPVVASSVLHALATKLPGATLRAVPDPNVAPPPPPPPAPPPPG